MKYREVIIKEDNFILDRINALGLSDYKLSKLIGVSYPYINMLRNGKAVASKALYDKLVEFSKK